VHGDSPNGPLPLTVPQIDVSTADPRHAEQPAPLSVSPASINRPREASTEPVPGERPLMQLLTLGLLIAMVVLISAAIGLVAGRWMTQR
jgi:hypothetical protein